MLLLPKEHRDEKEFIKEGLKQSVDGIIESHQHMKKPYFIIFHGRFNNSLDGALHMSAKVTFQLPVFMSNQIVFYVDNSRGLSEWLYSVTNKKKIEFNKTGVAYLQLKGAMPK